MTLRIKDSSIAEEKQWFLYQCGIFTKCFVDLHRSLEKHDTEKSKDIINNIREYAILELDSRKEFIYDLEINLAKLEVLEKMKSILS